MGWMIRFFIETLEPADQAEKLPPRAILKDIV
jgi:hypothetical protein